MMKTPLALLGPRIAAAALAVGALVACAGEPAPPEEAGAEAPAWTVPPRVEAARREGGAMVISGVAQPGGRVVMRAPDGTAHAVTADGDGRFALRIAGSTDLFLTPEGQAGQAGLQGPDRIVILAGGPAVALSPGAASRRLDAATGFTSLDSDGVMTVLSGRAEPGAEVAVGLASEPPLRVSAGPDGRWSVRVEAGRLGSSVEVDGRERRLPTDAPAAQGVGRVEDGWVIGWATPDGARILTWIPGDG